MSHPLFWPGKYYWFPIGNTAAVCYSRDLAPEEPGNILLLGCGDPRNVLYTIYNEPTNGTRRLDFTCCDSEPAVLARNVLLLTLVIDQQSYTNTVWNIFYHLYLDDASHQALLAQCRKLVALADTAQRWRDSPYGRIIRFCSDYSRNELQRHWSLYADMHELPEARKRAIREAFSRVAEFNLSTKGVAGAARSAGPLTHLIQEPSISLFSHYWKTGTTIFDSPAIAQATLINPTFVYSLAGEGGHAYHRTEPLAGFHLAAVAGNSERTVTMMDIVEGAKAEFSDWCTAFISHLASSSSRVPIIRLVVGDAMAVCSYLERHGNLETIRSTTPVAQWKTQPMAFNKEYASEGFPDRFNVIDTSNLVDHIDLLNVLIIALPLLEPPPRPSVLYTESLLFEGLNPTKDFARRLRANLTVMSLLLGVTPIDYVSGFSSRSNTHDLMLHAAVGTDAAQFHQVTTWKTPLTGDPYAYRCGGAALPPVFDHIQLGTFLYDLYHALFEKEDVFYLLGLKEKRRAKALAHSDIIHINRETYVLFLKLVKGRLCISREVWNRVMLRFWDLFEADQTLVMDKVYGQEFVTQLHLHHVVTLPFLSFPPQKLGRFAGWASVPTLVRVILIVPRERLSKLSDIAQDNLTPPLQCDILGPEKINSFASVHAAFGHAYTAGTRESPRVSFEQDPEEWNGTSPLIVSFILAARYLEFQPHHLQRVALSIPNFSGSARVTIAGHGESLCIHSADLTDESSVLLVPERHSPPDQPSSPISSSSSPSVVHGDRTEIGTSGRAVVALDEQCELVTTMTCTVSIENEVVQWKLGEGAQPSIVQISPCTMKLTLCGRVQYVTYPFPVIGSQNRLRPARKSRYIEVVVPVYGPFKPEGMKLNPFPVIDIDRQLALWSMHRVNLRCMPSLVLGTPGSIQRLDAHVGNMMSNREHSLLREGHKGDKGDPMLNLKQSLSIIFCPADRDLEGRPRRLLALLDDATNNFDTLIFVDTFHYDLQYHTIVCSGYVLPTTEEFMSRMRVPFGRLVELGRISHLRLYSGGLKLWKQLLPALAERCRYSWQHTDKCEYRKKGTIPLSEESDEDPLCSCGRGKDVACMNRNEVWRPFAPHVTRIALSPLFAVSYLETVGRQPSAHRCFVCRGNGKPKIMACGRCNKVRYCSKACQKNHWREHKTQCVTSDA
ncbi:hypothetical protein POSPLADRAFT_1181158 [Postia placenta MAD-698-R-SB12]|uniref:MYND-type domain-containing protein n=1 Tax=Postia placenta MAD-698-R-SB12 TaxID=670580 RepID=A0A1X6N3U8_9APHY|nr:hypothetical protein POSPLADRAFT_1181158 [Postia placenta MAD-698-R-SB12]OSX63103.1 hypothetical protein POSPLADRAFT_1181158 [Postia placenta MAD-698-R-SB12]